jgi:hypothetical protein
MNRLLLLLLLYVVPAVSQTTKTSTVPGQVPDEPAKGKIEEGASGALNATRFPGAPDIGLQINSAMASFPANANGDHCGEVLVPAGTWYVSTPILKPTCGVIRGQGKNNTHLMPSSSYSFSAHPALVIIESATTPPIHQTGGIYDLSIESGTSIKKGTIGVFSGGDPGDSSVNRPPGTISPANGWGEGQTFEHVRVYGFDKGWEGGGNTFWINWYDPDLVGNNVGVYELTSATDSGEAISFYGGKIVANQQGAFNGALWENRLFGVGVDFNSSGAEFPNIANAVIYAYGCHFEIGNGYFYSSGGSGSFYDYNSVFLQDNMTGGPAPRAAFPYLFAMSGNGNFSLTSSNVYSALKGISELVHFTNAANYLGTLTINQITGNGNGAIPAFYQAGFAPTPNTYINARFNLNIPAYSGAAQFFGSSVAFTGRGAGIMFSLNDLTPSAPSPKKRFFMSGGSWYVGNSEGTSNILQQTDAGALAWGNGTPIANSSAVPQVASPSVNQAACIKSAGPPVVIGYCSTAVSSGGTCSCK